MIERNILALLIPLIDTHLTRWRPGMLRAMRMLFLLSLTLTGSVHADPGRARYAPHPRSTVLSFRPVKLSGGSRLTLVSPRDWEDTAAQLGTTLAKTHERFSRLFGVIPAINTSIRLMEAEEFYRRTGAPAWTNALYYREEILLPIEAGKPLEFEELVRAVKHEYTHAILHGLTDGRCPGWLDEGLAQWAEGDENPALQPALFQWLRRHPPVSLSLLRGGFTRLDAEMVPAAYAQSLFASDLIITTFGFEALSKYFDFLREEYSSRRAFKRSFGISEAGFETHLHKVLSTWKNKRQHRHREKIHASLAPFEVTHRESHSPPTKIRPASTH